MMSAALLAVSAIGFSSCTEDKHYYVNEGAWMDIDEFEVVSADWVWDNVEKRYYADFEASKMTRNMLEQGTVLLGIYINDGSGWKLQNLPLTEAVNLDLTYFIYYRLSEGHITLYSQYSDLANYGSPGALTVKVSLFSE